MRSEGFYVNEISNDTSWDQTSDLPICSTAPYIYIYIYIYIVTPVILLCVVCRPQTFLYALQFFGELLLDQNLAVH